MFLTSRGTKLVDFGLARPVATEAGGSLSLESDLTRSGLIVGTPRYMAPEQILGDPIDARTDVFAAGLVLFEALAGRPAFPETKAVEVMHATLHEQPPALAGPAAVVAFDRVIRRALAKSPAERFPTAEAMSRELDEIVLGDSGASAPAARALTRLVVLPFRVLRSDPEVDFLGLALADAVSSSLSGPRLARRPLERRLLPASRARRPICRPVAIQPTSTSSSWGPSPFGGPLRGSRPSSWRLPSGTLTWLRRHDGVGGGRPVPPAGRAHAPDRRAAHAAPRKPDAARAPGRDSRQRARLRVVPARQPRSPVTAPSCPSRAISTWAAWRTIRLRTRLGSSRPDPSADRQVPGDPRALANWPAPEDALRRALDLSPRATSGAQALLLTSRPRWGGPSDAMVRLLRLAAEAHRDDAELFAGLVHVCRYCGLFDASLAAHGEAQRLDPHLSTGVVHTLWQRGEFEAVLEQKGDEGQASRAFALLALGRREEALEAWETVARAFSPQTPVVREWVDGVRDFLSLSQASRPAVFRNLDGAFDPEEIFFVGTQAARLAMPEATEVLGRAVDAGYPCWDALTRHPWMAEIRDQSGFADVVRRAERARERALDAFREAGGEALLGREALPCSGATALARGATSLALIANDLGCRVRPQA